MAASISAEPPEINRKTPTAPQITPRKIARALARAAAIASASVVIDAVGFDALIQSVIGWFLPKRWAKPSPLAVETKPTPRLHLSGTDG